MDSLWNAYVSGQEHTVKCTVQINTENTAQSFGRFGQMAEWSFTNYVVLGSNPAAVTVNFMLGKFEFYWFFHGLMISEKNIDEKNIKWFTRSCNLMCRSLVFAKKDLCFERHLMCFVSLYLPRSCLVLVACNKTNIPFHSCLISKLFTLGNIIFNYLGWIIFDIKKRHGIFAYY